MSFSLVNNLGSLESQSRLATTGAKLNSTIQRLSSGLRINNSGDDAAGLSIANKYRSDVAILSQGIRNANDGLSTLQIVDGGLNTISNLLDRAATLSAQSASDTFTGDRNTLQAEFAEVLDEISRQAKNIGLVSGGGNNKALTTIIGGGTDSFSAVGSNNGVVTDLSGTANQVDAAGLGLASLNIGAGAGSVTGSQAIGASGITAAETLSFQAIGSGNELQSFSVNLSNGSKGSDIIDAINNDASVKNAGITASLDSSNQVVLSSANFFTVSSDQSGAGSTGLVANDNDVAITGAANSFTLGVNGGAAAATTQTISFSGEKIGFGGTAKNVTFSAAATAALGATAIADSVNNDLQLRAVGVFAIKSAADSSQVTLVSLKGFNVAVGSSSVLAADNNIDTLSQATAATAGTLTGGAQGAKQALDDIAEAVATLGKVQGVVGAGQNRLRQAVDLASSQITSFQSAESLVRDADVSAEASNLARLSVLQQAGLAALAQANQSSQAVLSLLR
jgi:flagellin